MTSYETTGRLIQEWNIFQRSIVNENGNNLLERIKSYGNRNGDLFNSVDNDLLSLIINNYCIYNSETEEVRNYINKSYEILSDNNMQVCNNCPISENCPPDIQETWNKFTSCLLIIYQIRNNASHLGKLENNERNRNFINFAFHILNITNNN